VFSHALAAYAEACETMPEVAARAPFFHLEGPYISREDGPRGAHPLAHVRPPDWDEFRRLQDASGGRIRILTMSAEYDESPAFIRKATASGVVVAIGHTAASGDQIRAAVDAGARFSTHLGNGAHGQIRRHPNYIWDQLAEDRLWASLIVDGHHLPPSVVKSFVRAKTPERCLLVSDITAMAGMPPGLYANTGIGDIEVLDDGRLVVAGQRQYLAGAALPIGVGVANVMRFAGVDLKTAVEMASARPAELIGLAPVRLEAGAPADLVLFDLPNADGSGPLGNLEVRTTIKAGVQLIAN
jgi:N-acetylglucosamine-6-phosphate deacetylase